MQDYRKLVRHSGNEQLFLAVELAVLALQTGRPLNIHAHGLRGTGKTTIMRAAKALLPKIKRIKGCPFNCDPRNPTCPEHAGLSPLQISEIGVEEITMPLLEISHSAKLGTVVGSIDLQKLTGEQKAEAALLPGTLARANRGVVFIDEINRLADTAPELADVLLDLMGTKPGRLQIEETGLPKVVVPVTVSVWAASNPDEDPGPLENIRKQLSDRFDCSIMVSRPSNLEELVRIITMADEPQASQVYSPLELDFELWSQVTFPPELLELMARMYLEYDLESIRALQSWYHVARLHAVRSRRTIVSRKDLQATARLCLEHRMELTLINQLERELSQQDSRVVHNDGVTGSEESADQEDENVGQRVQAAGGETASGGFLSRLFRNLQDCSVARDSDKDSGVKEFSPYLSSLSRAGSITESIQGELRPPHDVDIVAPPLPARRLRELRTEQRVRGEGSRKDC